jgi:hypothetical protein
MWSLVGRFLSGQKCEELLMDYAALTANFTRCFIQHARPITVCQNCIDDYVQVLESYTNITEVNTHAVSTKSNCITPLIHYNFYKLFQLKDDSTGKACKLELINVDRLEVIEKSFEYVTLEWKSAFCSS